jgi:hypothetical protein
VFTLTETLLSVEMTLAEAMFLCHDKCQNETPVFTVHKVLTLVNISRKSEKKPRILMAATEICFRGQK